MSGSQNIGILGDCILNSLIEMNRHFSKVIKRILFELFILFPCLITGIKVPIVQMCLIPENRSAAIFYGQRLISIQKHNGIGFAFIENVICTFFGISRAAIAIYYPPDKLYDTGNILKTVVRRIIKDIEILTVSWQYFLSPAISVFCHLAISYFKYFRFLSEAAIRSFIISGET